MPSETASEPAPAVHTVPLQQRRSCAAAHTAQATSAVAAPPARDPQPTAISTKGGKTDGLFENVRVVPDVLRLDRNGVELLGRSVPAAPPQSDQLHRRTGRMLTSLLASRYSLSICVAVSRCRGPSVAHNARVSSLSPGLGVGTMLVPRSLGSGSGVAPEAGFGPCPSLVRITSAPRCAASSSARWHPRQH
jgi:hypothetical protein